MTTTARIGIASSPSPVTATRRRILANPRAVGAELYLAAKKLLAEVGVERPDYRQLSEALAVVAAQHGSDGIAGVGRG